MAGMRLLAALLAALIAGASVAEPRRLHLHSASKSNNDSEFQDSLDFLLQYRPQRDASLGLDFFRTNVQLALNARHRQPWAEEVPFALFLDYVLPYANVDEPREDWRGLFYGLFSPLVVNATSITEAALILNRDLWKIWGIHFKSDQTPEIMSPSQVIKAGFASCTGLSIFLVNAYRSVGIPARVAGTPSWTNHPTHHPSPAGTPSWNNHPTSPERFNNHNWVEVWDRGTWSFTGPTEWTPLGFNHTWFVPDPAHLAIPGNLMHAIYAATFRPSAANASTYFPLAWNPSYRGVPAVDVTDYYLNASAVTTATFLGVACTLRQPGSAPWQAGLKPHDVQQQLRRSSGVAKGMRVVVAT